MNIQQASRLTRLSPRQIREYERKGLLKSVVRRDNGYRDYQIADIERLKFIYSARTVGFSFPQIAELLALYENPHRSNSEVKRVTLVHMAALTEQIAHLHAIQSILQDWQQRCPDDGSAECSILAGLMQANIRATQS